MHEANSQKYAILAAVFFLFLVGILFFQLYNKPNIASSENLAVTQSYPSPTQIFAAVTSIVSSPTAVPSMAPSSRYPSQILNLKNWKITVPLGNSEHPTEIKQPSLARYKIDPWFVVVGDAVRFRAPVNAVTTSGSNYPRSELREMINNGVTNASWSSTVGRHVFSFTESITAVPTHKRQVVAGQIHDNNDDIMVIRLDYPHLYVNVNGDNVYTLNDTYILGTKFSITFDAHDGKTDVYYNGSTSPVYTLTKKYSNSYFKVGAYTQSNCSKEIDPSLCKDGNYGEVMVYSTSVTHS